MRPTDEKLEEIRAEHATCENGGATGNWSVRAHWDRAALLAEVDALREELRGARDGASLLRAEIALLKEESLRWNTVADAFLAFALPPRTRA